MVDVSMPSSRRDELDSNSSFQTCLGSLDLIFTSNPLCDVPQDLLRDFVGSSVAPQPIRQLAVRRQRLAGPLARHLGGDLRNLVAEPLLGLRLRAAGLLQVLAVRLDRSPELVHPLLVG